MPKAAPSTPTCWARRQAWTWRCNASITRHGCTWTSSDDIDAEADRLEKLGARRIGFVKRWWVMEAPSGHRFCVVRMRDRAVPANQWP